MIGNTNQVLNSITQNHCKCILCSVQLNNLSQSLLSSNLIITPMHFYVDLRRLFSSHCQLILYDFFSLSLALWVSFLLELTINFYFYFFFFPTLLLCFFLPLQINPLSSAFSSYSIQWLSMQVTVHMHRSAPLCLQSSMQGGAINSFLFNPSFLVLSTQFAHTVHMKCSSFSTPCAL